MTDNMNVHATLTASDEASAKVKALRTEVKSLEEQLKKSFAKKKLTNAFVSEDTLKFLEKINKRFSLVTDGRLRWAKGEEKANKLSMAGWQKLVGEIEKYESGLKKAGFNAKKFGDVNRRELQALIQKAAAYRYVWNNAYGGHERLEKRLATVKSRLASEDEKRQRRISAARDLDAKNRLGLARDLQKLDRQNQSYKASEAKQKLDLARDLFRLERQNEREKRNELAAQLRAARQMFRLRQSTEAGDQRVQRQQLREQISGIRNSFALRQRMERQEHQERVRNRAQMLNAARQVGGRGRGAISRLDQPFFNSPFSYALAGTAATAAAGKKVLGVEKDTDAAEVNTRIYGGLSKEQARELRTNFAAPKAVEFGSTAAEILTAYTDALKIGIKSGKGAEQFTELASQASEGWEKPMTDVSEFLGNVNTIIGGFGDKFDAGKLRSVANTLQYLAAEMSTTPEKMMSFMRKGAGAAGMLGMSQEAGLGVGAALTSAGVQAGSSGRMFDFMASRIIDLPDLVKKKGQQGDHAREMVRLLGFGSVSNLDRKRRANPDDFMFDFVDRFAKIKNPKKREQATKFFTGNEWFGEFGRLVDKPEILREARKHLKDSKNIDALGDLWKLHTTKLGFVFKQIKAGFYNILGEFGMELSPLASEVGAFFVKWSTELTKGGIRERFKQLLQGLVEGFLGGPGSLTDLMTKAIGKPGEGNGGDPREWFKFAKGFAEGLTTVGNVVVGFLKSVGAALGADTTTSEGLGKLAAEILGFSAALYFSRPAFGLIGGIKDAVMALAFAFIGLNSVLKFFGVSGGLMGMIPRAGAFAAGTPLLVSIASLAIAAIPVMIMNWDQIKPAWEQVRRAFNGGTLGEKAKSLSDLDSAMVGGYTPEFFARKIWESLSELVSKPKPPGQGTAESQIEGLRNFHLQSYEGNDFRDYIRKASLNSVSTERNVNRVADSIQQMGARLQLASLSGPGIASGIGSSGSFSGFGGGGGGGGGGSSSAPSVFNSPGVRNFGLGRRGILGGSGFGGSGNAFSGTGGAAFASKAPTIMARLQKDFGLSKEQAAGIVGNLGHESQGFTAFNQKGGGSGIGWAQWSGSRHKQFLDWARARNLDPQSDEANYGFLKHELTNTPYRKAIDAVRGQSTAEGSMRAFEGVFEGAGVKNYPSRMRYTNQALAASSAAPPGLADSLGIRGSANLMRGQFGPPGSNLVPITSPSGKKTMVHAAAAESFQGFINELEGSGYHINSLGGHNHRLKRGGHSLSQHAFGNAIDINPQRNPFGRQLITDMPQNVRDMAAKWGLSWGGDWKSVKDAMHFEWTGRKPWMENDPSKAIADVPAATPASMTKDVPVPPARPDFGGGAAGGGGHTIHAPITIHGGNHDPESLANAVQRRISDQINWRTHDVEHDVA
jgi:TP901 family phage tail tape measure protein